MAKIKDYGAYAQCACSLAGYVKRNSPPILEGGSTRHTVWTIQDTQGGEPHDMLIEWSDESRKFEVTCLLTSSK